MFLYYSLIYISHFPITNVMLLPQILNSKYVLSSKADQTINSVQFSHLVMSNSLRPHGLQHIRLPCPSPTPSAQTHVLRVGDVIQLSRPLLSPFPPAFNISQHQDFFQCVFSLGGQNIGVSSSASVLPMNIQD